MVDASLAARVEAVRRFSRFYTRRIGLLHEGLLGGPLSLTEGRIIYELAQAGGGSASALGQDLGLDTGYLSRILRGLVERGLLDRRPSDTDGRQSLLSLTPGGLQMFAALNARAHAEIATMLAALSVTDQQSLATALETAEGLLDGGRHAPARVPYILRPNRPGDTGWVVHRHGALYAQEYGWDERFEAMVAAIVAKFIDDFDPRRERCWIAERDGAIVGSVFLVKDAPDIAKLRLLYVEPTARGLGIGRRLVDECLLFARQSGYRRITLWTNDVLTAARRIYQQAGFSLIAEERHHSFGHGLVGQNWEREL